ncbi:MAG: hypothetical protein H0V44_10770 [Planctomycetes bacterium]|nr:hypothetical protein [Planctomycetota bacterium]
MNARQLGLDPIILRLPGALKDLLSSARRQIAEQGGSLTGDHRSGSFTVKTPLGAIRGTYRVQGADLAVTIADKPLLVSRSRIEKQLRRYFDAAG